MERREQVSAAKHFQVGTAFAVASVAVYYFLWGYAVDAGLADVAAVVSLAAAGGSMMLFASSYAAGKRKSILERLGIIVLLLSFVGSLSLHELPRRVPLALWGGGALSGLALVVLVRAVVQLRRGDAT